MKAIYLLVPTVTHLDPITSSSKLGFKAWWPCILPRLLFLKAHW